MLPESLFHSELVILIHIRIPKSTFFSFDIFELCCFLYQNEIQSVQYLRLNWKTMSGIDVLENYRPISLLSCVGQIRERCVYKHIYNHLYFKWLVKFNPWKTEAILFSNFSNRGIPYLSLSFENMPFKSVTSHKHLGLMFSNNCKW